MKKNRHAEGVKTLGTPQPLFLTLPGAGKSFLRQMRRGAGLLG